MNKYSCDLTDEELSDKEYVKAYISSFNEDYSVLLKNANRYRIAAQEEAKFVDEYRKKEKELKESLKYCIDFLDQQMKYFNLPTLNLEEFILARERLK